MPKYKYNGGAMCRYGGQKVLPGDVIDASGNPDPGVFEEVGAPPLPSRPKSKLEPSKPETKKEEE